MRIGLFLGKFAPLHKGHVKVIRQMIAETDYQIVLLYDTLVTDIPLLTRRLWFIHHFPKVQVIPVYATHLGSDTVGYTPEIKVAQQDIIDKALNGQKITHVYGSEKYINHVSKALGAKPVFVPHIRGLSGTAIRKDPFKYRNSVTPQVYEDLIKKVCFLGAPSCGKSTMAEEMAKYFGTTWMPEYGREYWEKNQQNHRLTEEQLVELAKGHILRERQGVLKARKYYFIDTSPLTTFIFSHYYHGGASPELVRLMRDTITYYDYYFLCMPDFPFDDTADRSGAGSREIMHRMNLSFLNHFKIPYIKLGGTLQQRKDNVYEVINA